MGRTTFSPNFHEKKKIKLSRQKDYRMKGKHMVDAIREFSSGALAIPLDIDEFIVLHSTHDGMETVSGNASKIFDYIIKTAVDPTKIYKMDYMQAIPYETCYSRPIFEILNFTSSANYGEAAKGFIYEKYVKNIDHGSHLSGEYVLSNFKGLVQTDLRLLHFHSRGYCHIRKKVLHELVSLGRDHYSLDDLETKLNNGTIGVGAHNVAFAVLELKGELAGKYDIMTRNTPVGMISTALRDALQSSMSTRISTNDLTAV